MGCCHVLKINISVIQKELWSSTKIHVRKLKMTTIWTIR